MGCFHILAIINSAAINTGCMYIFELVFSFASDVYPGVELLDHFHGVAKSRTQLSDFTFTFHFHALEKEMVTHSSVLAWRIPGTGKPGGLPSIGLHRVRYD